MRRSAPQIAPAVLSHVVTDAETPSVVGLLTFHVLANRVGARAHSPCPLKWAHSF
jgi:hypothetical protein